MKNETTNRVKFSLNVDECCEALGIKRTSFYKLVATNQIVVFKIGRRRLVDVRSVRALIDRSITKESELIPGLLSL